jgi:hypothetical protein
MTAGLNRSESSDPVNGRRVSLSISRSDDWWNNCLSSCLLWQHITHTKLNVHCISHNWSGCFGPQ